MAREGPLLSSVRRLTREVDQEEILSLPVPPLPVRLWADETAGEFRVDLLIHLGDTSDTRAAIGRLAESGAQIGTWTGRTATASAAVNELGRLLDNDLDVLVDAAASVRPSLDVSVPEAWNADIGNAVGEGTGEGVVIGIVDSGIDLTHESFRTATGSTRVLALRNQILPGPRSEWDSATIDGCLSSGALPRAMVDPTGHGTAVAGVAAGNGLAAPSGRYVGLAPSADLVVVAIQAPRQAYGSTANLVDAASYVFEYAEARNQRAVVNISQGVQIGAHDPAGALEFAFSDLLSQDERRVLVVSAGNTGGAGAHARLRIAEGQQLDIAVDVPVGVGPVVLVDIWYDVDDELELSVLAPDGSETGPVKGSETRWLQIGQSMCEISGVPNQLSVRANNVQVKLLTTSYSGDLLDGRWVLRLTGTSMTSGSDVHAWLDRGWLASPRFGGRVLDRDCTLTSPATARGVLAVGSYQVSPAVGPLASSSARGPARLGDPVNLLAAPGESITTSAASPWAAAAHTRVRGTSIAAAHVTGAVALLLQANPRLTRAQITDCILANARTDEHTAAGPESGWGFGKLDISAALAYARALNRNP
jgi:minor extracellular serine protease Vpr